MSMASAGLKRPSPSDVPPHASSQLSPNSYWAVNKRRCTTQMAQQQRLFRDPAAIIGSLSDDVTLLIKNEVNKQQQQQQQQQQNQHHHILHHHHHNNHHHHQHQHHHQQPQQTNQHHNQQQHNQLQPDHSQAHLGTSAGQLQQNQNLSNTSNTYLDTPVLSIRQTQAICEKLIKEREQKLRDEYDKILISKLSEQYDTFVKYTHDHIERRYNETNSHQASYLS